MSVRFFDCAVCGTSVCDAGDYVSCDCGREWCDYECASVDGFEEQEDYYDEEDEEYYECEEGSTCKYCRKEDFEDSELLEFAIEMYGTTRETLIQEYKEKLMDE